MASRSHSDIDSQEKLRQVEGSPQEQPEIGELKTALPKRRVGFECEFVERPPDIFQSDCPVCLLIIREPNQVTCCGYSFCRACIARVVASKKPCPTCNEAEFSVFPDKRLQRSLYQFRVRCEHQKEGCEWSGELGQLDKHLNENPGLGHQLDGCEFTRVACIHCVQLFERRLVTAHQIGSCPRRPFSCDYCGDYAAHFEDVVTNHWPVCEYRPVPCPNECGVYPERRNVHDHVNKDCPLTRVICDFDYAGCQVRLPRKDIQSHLNDNLSSHMALLGAHSQRMAEKVMEKDEQIRRLSNELSKEVEENKRQIDEVEKENQTLRNSLEQKIANLSREGKEALRRAQEASKRKRVALKEEIAQLTLKECENLKQELSRKQDESLKQQVAEFRRGESRRAQETTPKGVFGRFRKGVTPSNDNEALKQEVAELSSKQEKLLSYVPMFPIDITMTDFEKHRTDDEVWCSDPFYTQPHGYKVCLRVHANDNRGGKDTHVSVYVNLMQGEFDNHLKWPFQVNVTFQLCNQLEDKEHRELSSTFSNTSDSKIVARVSSEEMASFGQGHQLFIPQNELHYNPAKKCQYLKDDCLRFQVTSVSNVNYAVQLEKRCSAIEKHCHAIESRVCNIIPPVDFTMTDFNQHKQDNEEWYSLPFYAHTGGYRMCLRVDANGHSSGNGTHVSVYVCLMCGEFDNYLKWPFRGIITIQLLNRLEDEEHHSKIISFNDTAADTSAGKVTRERGVGRGYHTFMAHSELTYNSTRYCQYLKDDCLCFRVTKVLFPGV